MERSVRRNHVWRGYGGLATFGISLDNLVAIHAGLQATAINRLDGRGAFAVADQLGKIARLHIAGDDMIFQQACQLGLAFRFQQTVERCLIQFGKGSIGWRKDGEWASARQGFAMARSGYGADERRHLRIVLCQCDDIFVRSGFGGNDIVRCHSVVLCDFGFGWRGLASATRRQSERRQADGLV